MEGSTKHRERGPKPTRDQEANPRESVEGDLPDRSRESMEKSVRDGSDRTRQMQHGDESAARESREDLTAAVGFVEDLRRDPDSDSPPGRIEGE